MVIMRRNITATVLLGLVVLLSGCSSSERQADRAQERAFEAQERVAQQRLHLVEEYQKCANRAGADPAKAAACESYLKAAEALR